MAEEDEEARTYYEKQRAEAKARTTLVCSSDLPNESTRTPLPGLVAIPTGMFAKYDKKGQLSFANAAKTVPTSGPPPTKPKPRQPTPQAQTTAILTCEELCKPQTTIAKIRANAKITLGVELPA
jgi:hypothetical protein